MKKQFALAMALAFAAFTTSAFAALKPGDKAPMFSAPASLDGHAFHFSLEQALKKGPVVVYFYPSAFTGGCDLEAHTFATEKSKFTAAGATIIGVSQDSMGRLKQFSADPKFCAGQFPVASNPSASIGKEYGVTVYPMMKGAKDVRGVAIDHGFFARTTFVINKEGKIVAEFSSQADHLTPPEHVQRALAIVRKLDHK
ncbi:MAG: peroxiredoxin [Acidobacteriaceae bacterium]